MRAVSIVVSSSDEKKCELDKKKLGIIEPRLQVSTNTILQEQKGFFKKGRIIKNILSESLEKAQHSIGIIGSVEDIKKFLLNNPELRNKTLELEIVDDMSRRKEYKFLSNEIDEIAEEFSMYPKAKIDVEGHLTPVNITECQKAVKILEGIVEQVQSLDLSPLEQLMFVYDVIKEKRYNAVTEEDPYMDSRELTPIILGDKIVCAGYALLFKTILNRLGFKNNSEGTDSKSNTPGHARNIVYVKDDKYNVEGILSFDTTWDSKKDAADVGFINRYRFFAETREQANSSKRKKNLKTPPSIKEMIRAVDGLISSGQWGENTEWALSDIVSGYSLNAEYKREIAELYKFFPIGKELDSQTAKELLETLRQYDKLYNTQLSPITFLSLVCNVREKQQQISLEKYPFSLVKLCLCLSGSSLELNGIKRDDDERKNERLKAAGLVTKDFWDNLEVKPNVVFEDEILKQEPQQVQQEESKGINRKK